MCIGARHPGVFCGAERLSASSDNDCLIGWNDVPLLSTTISKQRHLLDPTSFLRHVAF